MIRRAVFAVVASALLGLPAAAFAAEPATPVTILPNGLVVIVKENHAAPVASVRVFVRTGAMYEGKYLGMGISHLCEHLVASGTTRWKTEDQYNKIIEELGNNKNASTGNQTTQYYIDTSAANVFTAIDVLAEKTLGATIPWPEWYREMGVVNREIERGEDNPDRKLYQLADQNMFRVSPARVPVIGYTHLFNQIQYQDVLSYYAERYVPNNMVFVAVGDFDAAKVREYAAKAFAGKKDMKPIPTFELPAEPEQVAPRSVIEEKEGLKGGRMVVAFRTVSLSSPDAWALDVASFILSRGASSRLVRVVRDEKRLADGLRSWSNTPNWDGGEFGVSAVIDPKNLEAARDAVLAEIYRLKDDLVSDEELRKAKAQKAAELAFGGQTVSAQAQEMGGNYLDCYDPDFGRRYVENIRQVTAEQIRDAARKYFRPEKLCFTALVPKGSGPASSQAAAVVPVTPVKKVVLANGITLLVRKNGGTPLVTMYACFAGGLRSEDRRTNGVSGLMANLLTRGTTTRTAVEIAGAFDSMGGEFGAGSGANSFTVNATVLNQDLAKGMDVFADMILNPTFPPKEFEALQERVIKGIERRDDDPMAEAGKFFMERMYLTSPYGLPPGGTEESVKALTVDDVRRYYVRYVNPRNMVLAIFGDVEPFEAEALATKYFGSFAGSGPFVRPEPALEGPLAHPRIALRVNKKVGAVVFLGAAGPRLLDVEDRAVLDVVQTVLCGYGYPGGWLHADLRGRQLVYEVHVQSVPQVEPGYLMAYARCQPAYVRVVSDTIMSYVHRMALVGPSPDEMEMAKKIIATSVRLRTQTNGAQAANAALNELYGLHYDFDDQQLARVQKVTLDDVRRVTRKYFTEFVLTVTAPDVHIADGLYPRPDIVYAK